jgi:hypothetical protein
VLTAGTAGLQLGTAGHQLGAFEIEGVPLLLALSSRRLHMAVLRLLLDLLPGMWCRSSQAASLLTDTQALWYR